MEMTIAEVNHGFYRFDGLRQIVFEIKFNEDKELNNAFDWAFSAVKLMGVDITQIEWKVEREFYAGGDEIRNSVLIVSFSIDEVNFINQPLEFGTVTMNVVSETTMTVESIPEELEAGVIYHKYAVGARRLSQRELQNIHKHAVDDVRMVLEFMEEFDSLLAAKLEAWQIPVMYSMFYQFHRKKTLGLV